MKQLELPYQKFRRNGVYNKETRSISSGTLEYVVPKNYQGRFQDGQQVFFADTVVRRGDGSKYCEL